MPHPLADDIPTFLFQISEATDFANIARKGNRMGHCTHFKVTAAGTVTVRLKMPRDGAGTEALVLEAGETMCGKVAEIVAADAGCFPITVWR
jgi:hypothetical protein